MRDGDRPTGRRRSDSVPDAGRHPQAAVGGFTAAGDPAEDFDRAGPVLAVLRRVQPDRRAGGVACRWATTDDGLPVGVMLAGGRRRRAAAGGRGAIERDGGRGRDRHPAIWTGGAHR